MDMQFVAVQEYGVWKISEKKYSWQQFKHPMYFALNHVLWFDFAYDSDSVLYVEFSIAEDTKEEAAIRYRAYGDRSIEMFKQLAGIE